MLKLNSIVDDTKRFYTTTDIANEIDRTAQTMRLWERKGILPKAPHIAGDVGFSKQGRRLYTLQHKESLRRLVIKHNVKAGIPFPKAFSRELKQAFEDLADNKTPEVLKQDI